VALRSSREDEEAVSHSANPTSWAVKFPIILILLGVFWWTQCAPCFFEAEVRARVSRVRQNLRVLADRMEAYRLDHGAYPSSLTNLTEPEAHLAFIPGDPFSRAARARLLLLVEADRYRIYSVGPDRVDDGGQLFYDPTNGSYSRGDVIRLGPPARWSTEEIQAIMVGRDLGERQRR
jgi:type II secretory pathway pseudopilin PulG